MLELYTSKLEDLWFRQQFLSDPATMAYNQAWGGTIDFPEKNWQKWYDYWIIHHENKRFYRYLLDKENQTASGIRELRDNISLSNPSLHFFLSEGFEEITRTQDCILVRKILS